MNNGEQPKIKTNVVNRTPEQIIDDKRSNMIQRLNMVLSDCENSIKTKMPISFSDEKTGKRILKFSDGGIVVKIGVDNSNQILKGLQKYENGEQFKNVAEVVKYLKSAIKIISDGKADDLIKGVYEKQKKRGEHMAEANKSNKEKAEAKRAASG